MGLTHTLILCPAALVFGVSIKLCYNKHTHNCHLHFRDVFQQLFYGDFLPCLAFPDMKKGEAKSGSPPVR